MSLTTGQSLRLRTADRVLAASVLFVADAADVVLDIEGHGVQRFVRAGKRWAPSGDRDWRHGVVDLEPVAEAPAAKRTSIDNKPKRECSKHGQAN